MRLFFRRLLSGYPIILFFVNLLIIFLFLLQYEFSYLYFYIKKSFSFYLLITLFLLAICCLFISYLIKKKNVLLISIKSILILCNFILILLCMRVVFVLHSTNPIIYSYTTDINNYLIFDENIEIVEQIFPKEIPDEANNIDYYYCKKSSYYTEVVARWSLNAAEFDEELQRIKSINESYQILEKGDFEYISLYDNFLEINNDYYILSFYAYDKNSLEVRYIYYCGLINELIGFQTSYYENLHWGENYFPTQGDFYNVIPQD